MLNLYDKLREIPLFQGLTSDNLMQIIGQTKFSFKKFGKNEIINEPAQGYELLWSERPHSGSQ